MAEDYYKTKASVEEYIDLAKNVNGSYLIDKLVKVLKPSAALLEIGSGPGTDWKLLSKLYKVTGSDNSLEFLKHLRTENPDGVFMNLDAISLDTDRKFDGIYSNKVLHHLTDEQLKKTVKNQCRILNDAGIVCHSFWKGEGTEVFKGLFVNYHNESKLTEFFSKYFNILSIESYKEFEDNDSLLFIGQKL